jgi:moderate conductance mechanosensitive channel
LNDWIHGAIRPLFDLAALPSLPLSGWKDWEFETWGPWVATRLLHAGIYILGAVALDLLWRVLTRRIKGRVEEKDPHLRSELDQRVRTLITIVRKAGTWICYGAVLLLIADDFGLKIGPFLAGLGIAGAALGFGAQYLVQDWIAGFFAVLEDQYRVGDVIQANSMTGTVERVTLRTTYLRATGGEVHIIQNGTIRAVTNFTRQWARAVLDVGVDYRSRMEDVFEALREVGRRAAADEGVGVALLEPAEVLGVTQMGESQMTVRLWVKTAPQRRWDVERYLRATTVEVFAARGIVIPFPQRTLHVEGPELHAALQPRRPKEKS